MNQHRPPTMVEDGTAVIGLVVLLLCTLLGLGFALGAGLDAVAILFVPVLIGEIWAIRKLMQRRPG